MTDTSDLGTDRFWRETLERAGRQLAQTLGPIVIAIGTGTGHYEGEATFLALAIAVAVTVIKSLAGIRPHPLEAWYWQIADRALPAAAGSALGFLSADLSDLAEVDWDRAGWACLTAALLAVLGYYITPPTSAIINLPPTAIVTPPLDPEPLPSDITVPNPVTPVPPAAAAEAASRTVEHDDVAALPAAHTVDEEAFQHPPKHLHGDAPIE